MTTEELKNAAREYICLCLDEIKDESYDYAEDELELDAEQCQTFHELVSSLKYKHNV